jgi:single-stranded-DNA-specific exonuclease RecJ
LSIADNARSSDEQFGGRNREPGNQEASESIAMMQAKTARGKYWRFPESSPLDPALLQVVDNCEVLARLLHRRGITSGAQALAFLDPQNYKPTSAMDLPDVAKAVVRINQAIELKEHITIYGDYDVDGVTGTSLLLTVLKEMGASVDFYIPNRLQEGYGLNLKAISILASKHRSKLLITCDCGVSNFAEINFANSLGVDTLVLDHHSMPEALPPAVGIVHPKLLDENHPLYHLPGVGVAYKVCEAILIDRGLGERAESLLDYVTLGMIADLVPLVAENRYLVQIGLPRLINSERLGIAALLAQVRKSEDTDLVGFGLAPRINAVGRLADAKAAVELLTTCDPQVADDLSRQLQNENNRRQEICERVFVEAEQTVTSQVDLEKSSAIAIYREGWHHGVVGIVASRLVEKFGRPVFIGELDAEESMVRGSARSVDGVDLYQVLKANEQLLARWGGHKMAAGFSVQADKAETLCRALVDTCNRMTGDKPRSPVLDIDLVVEETDVSMELVRRFSKLAPFGMANKKPLICLTDMTCESSRSLGKEGKHHRVMLKGDNGADAFECVMWNSYGKVPGDGEIVDIVFSPEINSYKGRERLQLVLSDWRNTQQGKDGANAPVEEMDRPGMETVQIPQAPDVPVSSVKPDLVDAPTLERSIKATTCVQSTWKDLRQHDDANQIIKKGLAKFGDQIAIFAEGAGNGYPFSTVDRCTVEPTQHLIIYQFPPESAVFQKILSGSQAKTIYLLGDGQDQLLDAVAFTKQLLGLIRFAIAKKEGKVLGEKLSAAMGTSKMATALGLSILRKLNVIDWYAEDGEIYLDLVGSASGDMEDLPEYRQLNDVLKQIQSFRQWCGTATLKELQLALMPNQIGLANPGKHTRDYLAERQDDLGMRMQEAVER